jgi:hypothetical protein
MSCRFDPGAGRTCGADHPAGSGGSGAVASPPVVNAATASTVATAARASFDSIDTVIGPAVPVYAGGQVTRGFHMANRPAGLCRHTQACKE